MTEGASAKFSEIVWPRTGALPLLGAIIIERLLLVGPKRWLFKDGDSGTRGTDLPDDGGEKGARYHPPRLGAVHGEEGS